MSLRWRLVLLVLIPSIPLFAITVYLAAELRRSGIDNAGAQLRALSMRASSELRAGIESATLLVATAAEVPGVAQGDRDACRRAFNEVLGEARRYASFFVTDARGRALCHSSDGGGELDVADREYFRRARDSAGPVVGEPVIGRVTRKPLMPIALPLRDASGTFRGVLFAGFDLHWFGEQFSATRPLAPFTFALWAADGTILYRFPEPEAWIGKRAQEAGIARAVLGRRQPTLMAEAMDVAGSPMLYAISGTESWSGTRMAVSVGVPRAVLVEEADAVFARSAVIFALVFAAALAAAVWLGEAGIRRKALAMNVTARRIAAGELHARTGARERGDELGQLAVSIDAMAQALERNTRTLKILSEVNQALIRAQDEQALLADVCSVIVDHGRFAACWVGYAEHDEGRTVRPVAQHGVSAEELAARRLTWADVEGGRGPIGEAIRRRSPVVVSDIAGDAGDSSSREFARRRGYASYAAFPIQSQGEVLGVLGIAAYERGRFDAWEALLLGELAADLGYGIRALRDRAALDRHAAELESLVQRRTADLQSANAFLDSVIENIPDMIFVKEAAELRFVRFNRAGEELLGYTREELVGKSDRDFFPAEQAEAFIARDREVLAAGHLVEIPEEPVQTRHRGMRYLRTMKIPVPDEHGVARYLLGISHDITLRKQSEQQILALNAALGQRAAELEAVNRELEAFSYSVSHDLRAPLRHVQGYVELLATSASGQMPEKAQRYLRIISEAAGEMGQLIDDLLAFSRTARTEMQNGRVDMEALVADCRRMLEMEVAGRRVEWRIDPLPAVHGDPGLLRQVWANLLGNAVKYTRPREVAVIEVGAIEREHAPLVFFVRDNGVGFDMQHTRKLFGVFQRLHRADEFEGTGIGLATVQRILVRHGGRIWAEAAPDRGATFFFTVAAAEAGRRASREAA